MVTVGFAAGASWADLLVNRGLPTANLNDPYGNASNASFGGMEPLVVGDTFSVGVAGTTYAINDIRVWVVGEPPAPTTLLGGYVSNGSAGISTISTTIISDSVVTYAGGVPYYDGVYPIHQVDFNVDMLLNGGQSYYFFAQGSDPAYSPFLSASNASSERFGAGWFRRYFLHLQLRDRRPLPHKSGAGLMGQGRGHKRGGFWTGARAFLSAPHRSGPGGSGAFQENQEGIASSGQCPARILAQSPRARSECFLQFRYAGAFGLGLAPVNSEWKIEKLNKRRATCQKGLC